MYRIIIEELTFKAIIGVLEKEREKEQLVVVNCKIDYEEGFIDYKEVCDLIENIIVENKFKLLEKAVDFIEKELLKKYPNMKRLFLQIKKPEILKNALVGVEILRKY